MLAVPQNYFAILPEVFLTLSALVLLVVGVFLGNKGTRTISQSALYCLVITGVLLLGINWDRTTLFNGMFLMDGFAGVMKLLVVGGLATALAMSIRYLYQEQINRFEYPVLVMFAGLGMMLMISANNLLAVYVGLELQSLCLYVLATFHRDMLRSAEAGLKYFVLGAVSSGLFLFGASLIYGLTGNTGFSVIASYLGDAESIGIGVLAGLLFIISGMAFKISAVPFHMWTPDVYNGAPTSATALFAIAPKVAAIALLIRLLTGPFEITFEYWSQIIWFLSAASMILGAFAALKQENIKRLMGYSAIGHIGYVLIGVAIGTQESIAASLLYLLVYMFMTAGTFAVILVMRRDNFALEDITDLSGVSKVRPYTAYTMLLMMLSMSGIPPLAGFFAKFSVFQAAIIEGYFVLAVIGVLTSVVAAFYYLRIVKVILFDEIIDPLDASESFSCRAVMLVASVFVLLFAIRPDPIIDMMQTTATTLFAS